MKDELEHALGLLEAATPGAWFPGHLCDDNHGCNCPFIFSEGQQGFGAIATVGTSPEDVKSKEEAAANQAAIAACVNFVRRHGAAIMHDQTMVASAVHAEREACAALIVEASGWCGGHGEPSCPTASDLARLIRARGNG